MFTLICFLVGLLGWSIVIGIILCLTGLQSKIFKAIGQSGGLVVTKTFKIPFIGIAEIASTSGQEIILKLKKK